MCVIKDKFLSKTNIAAYINVTICFLLPLFVSITGGTEIQKAIEARKQGHYLKAIEYLLQTLSKNLRSVEANVELGTNYSKRGELDQAVQHYQRALELTLTHSPPTTIWVLSSPVKGYSIKLRLNTYKPFRRIQIIKVLTIIQSENK